MKIDFNSHFVFTSGKLHQKNPLQTLLQFVGVRTVHQLHVGVLASDVLTLLWDRERNGILCYTSEVVAVDPILVALAVLQNSA